jgi:hypothetical protein
VIDFDRYVLVPALTTFGQAVLYFPGVGQAVEFLAVFDERYREVTFRDGLEVVETRPVLGFRVASLPNGRLPVLSEVFRVAGRFYAVSSPAEADGQGHCKVALRFATDAEQQLALAGGRQ